MVSPRAGDASPSAKEQRRKTRRINFLMRAVSPSGKQDAPPCIVNELVPNSQRPRPNEKLSDRRGPADRPAKYFVHARAGRDLFHPRPVRQREDDPARAGGGPRSANLRLGA